MPFFRACQGLLFDFVPNLCFFGGMKNIVYRCKLSRMKQKLLLHAFNSGTSARRAAREVAVNRSTAQLFYRKLRKAIFCSRVYKPKIKGTVEVDECYLSSGEGGRKVARQGRSLAGKIAIIGAISRESRRVFLKRIPNTQKSTLTAFCRDNISRNSTIHTDSLSAYSGLKDSGFKHLTVNHFLTFKNFKTGACTNLIESVWAVLRRHLGNFCGGWRNNLELWLAEIEWRIENRLDLKKALKKILRHA